MADAPDLLMSVENLTVRLGGHNILSNVDLSLRSCELTGLIGSNGAGKTTLLRAILGLVRPSSGRVTIEGRPRLGRDRSVGYVPQSVALDPDVPLRARDLVALGVDGHRFGIPLPSKSRRRIVDEALETVGASELGGQAVGTLSGGQRQRVLIAHALAGSPRLLLLDEPLANLDPRAERQMVDVLDHIAHSHSIGVLISTHDMNPLLHAMDRVAYITAGRLASGPTHEVLSTDSLSRLYGHHVDVIRVHDRLVVVPGASEKAFEHHVREPVTSVI